MCGSREEMNCIFEVIIPQLSLNTEIAYISCLRHCDGEYVKKGEVIIEVEVMKTIYEIVAEHSGFIKYLCKENEEFKLGAVAAKIIQASTPKECNYENEKEGPIFSRKALDLIMKNNLDKEIFKKFAMVGEEDVKKFLNYGCTLKTEKYGDIARKTVTKGLLPDSITSTIYIHIKVGRYEEQVCSSTYLQAVIISKLSILLKKYKELNAYYQNGTVVFYDHVGIGIAIDAGKGLEVVSLKVSDETDIDSYRIIENKILMALRKYLKNELTPEDTNDVTFTVSDLSNEGIDFFSPVVPWQQSAIIGIPAINSVTKELMLSLSFDHRVVNGKRVCQFLRDLKNLLEAVL